MIRRGSAAGEGDGSTEGIGSILAARAFAYNVVKSAFWQEPSREFIRLLIKGEIVRAFPFADTDPAIARALDRIGEYLDQPDVLSTQGCEGLHWDFTRMFVGPGRVPAPPWESVYRNVERLHFSEETLEVRAAYRMYNLTATDFGREPDDHIGLELDFLHRLCEMAQETADAADAASLTGILIDQRAFLDGHLLRWVPEWARDVVKSAETGFYKGMAQLLDAYLRLDRDLVEELLEATSRNSSEQS